MVHDSLHENAINLGAARVEPLPAFEPLFPGIEVYVLRLDLIHPIVSGNKYFKLLIPLRKVLAGGKKGILTYGGAYSNHLVATAFICKLHGLRSIGIVRGEEPRVHSPTLVDAASYGMELRFVSRDNYREVPARISEGWEFVPEGGASAFGAIGAAEIVKLVDINKYTHIVSSVGTGTTLAGLIQNAPAHVRFLGMPALKISSHENELKQFIEAHGGRHFKLIYDYHFGGYAKKNQSLLDFMNHLYERYQLPTDFVYTGKLFYGISDLIKKEYFGKKASLLVIHSGGLQGNRSLPANTLKF